MSFPNSIDYISRGSFKGTSLVSAFIPANITYIDDYAFETNTIVNVTVEGKTFA